MASYRILAWHDIPLVIEARDQEGAHKAQLSDRFQELIDRVAMRRRLVGTDAYLEGWRRGRPVQREGSAAAVAAAVAKELEDRFDEIKAAALAGE